MLFTQDNQLWASRINPVARDFPDFEFTSIAPMKTVTSMANASDGKFMLIGGMGLYKSFNGGKTWENIPRSDPALIEDLLRLTDTDYLGTNVSGQLALKVNPDTKAVLVQAITPSISGVSDLRLASLDTAAKRVEVVGMGSLNGFAKMSLNDDIWAMSHIIQVLIGDSLVNLDHPLRGAGFSTVDGNVRIRTSDIYGQYLYDMDLITNPPTAARFHYADAFNGRTPYLIDGSLRIFAVVDTLVGGYYASSIDGQGNPRAFIADFQDNEFYDVSPNKVSSVVGWQDGLIREKFNGQVVHKAVVWPLDGAVIIRGRGLPPLYIGSGIGQFKFFLPSVFINQ